MPLRVPVLVFLASSAAMQAQSLNVRNPSFETATLPLSFPRLGTICNLIAGSPFYAAAGSLADWTAASTTVVAGAGGFSPTTGQPNWTAGWQSGHNIAYLQIKAAGTVSLSQTLSDVLQNNTAYRLSALVARRIFKSRFNYSLQLWADQTLLASASNLTLANDTSGTDVLMYSSGANTPQAGQPLRIVLASSGIDGVLTEVFFDSIALTATAQPQTTNTAALQVKPRPPLGPSPSQIPSDMQVCIDKVCRDWIGTPEGFFQAWPDGTYSPVTVESFTPQSVILHRTDLPGTQSPGLIGLYTGKMSGNQITGTATFRWPDKPGSSTLNFTATWAPSAHDGDATLHKVPAEAIKTQLDRAGKNARVSGQLTTASGPVHLDTGSTQALPSIDKGPIPYSGPASCIEVTTAAESERAVEIGKRAARSHRDAIAFNCFLVAARQGDASAQVDVAYAYLMGLGVTASAPDAFHWYMEAAKNGNTYGQMAVAEFYSKGTSGVINKSEAERWTTQMWTLRNQHTQICSSDSVKDTIAHVEKTFAQNAPFGALLGSIAGALTGVQTNFENADPELAVSEGSDILQADGRFHIDLGMQTGDFLCRATFFRGHIKGCRDSKSKPGTMICAGNDGNDADLTEIAIDVMLARFNNFFEMFRVRPLQDGRYQVTLVPTSIQFSGTYSGITEMH